ncbi:MAG: iron ABC transporter substrate-binding protein [Mediterranea massiliensis]|nr:iron ABC transporter substrate-binding protein [Mediterranea massiliensis]
MKHILLSAHIVIFVLLLSACGGRSKTSYSQWQGDTLSMRYAHYLTLVDYDGYTLAEIRNPWDTLHTLHTYLLIDKSAPLPSHLPEGTVLRTPLSKALFYSSVHCSLLKQLDALQTIGGVCDLNYINLPEVKQGVAAGQIVDCGDATNPDIEQIIELYPDAILLSPFENSGGYGRVGNLDIPLIECADYMETSPLGRAEWMRFYGRLVGKSAQADSLFVAVEANYIQLKTKALQAQTQPSVIPDLRIGSTWYMPGGRSYIGRLFQDANINYAYADDTHSGSVPLSFETVFDKAGQADIWLIRYNRPDCDMTYNDLSTDFAGYTGLKAFKQRQVYGCNTAHCPYYEEIPFRPDYLLNDYIRIFHPEIGDLDDLRYFCPLQ